MQPCITVVAAMRVAGLYKVLKNIYSLDSAWYGDYANMTPKGSVAV